MRAKIKPETDCEIIVVNNDTSENLKDLSFLFPEIKILISPKNFGFGSAANIGANEAIFDILFFLNPDTEIINGKICCLLEEFENNPEIGIIGPRLIDRNGNTECWFLGKEPTLLKTIGNNFGFFSHKKILKNNKKTEVDWISGAAFFVRKDIFKKLAGFDEKFFLYFEDVDFCRRTKQSRWKVLYFPEFIVRHLGGKSFSSQCVQKKHFYRSQKRYFLKHYGKIQAEIIDFLRRLTHNLKNKKD